MSLTPNDFEVVIGLEVHVQLATDSKIFSTARARATDGKSVSEEAVNANTTPVCGAHPGTLPVLNGKALEYAIKAGLATGCTINTETVFSRKHYFYPDLPKGYQISQYDKPVCENGFIQVEIGETTKRIGIQRIHMEEDAGKSVHMSGFSLVNLNRAGVPLIEVVSHPDMRSAEEAGDYLRKLYSVVTALGVCDGNLQEGNFRCDANVSVRPKGQKEFGTRTETKNVNSFRFVEKAIEVETQRQIQVILSGGKIVQETRLYDSAKNQTFSMRTKEEAEDYRYFPDPDLPTLLIDQKWIDELKSKLPELPDQKRDRYMKDFALGKYDAAALTGSLSLSNFFEATLNLLEKAGVSKTVAAKPLSNLMTGELTRLLNDSGKSISETEINAQHFSDLVQQVQSQTISVTAAKQIITHLFESGGDVISWIEKLGLKQVSDVGALEKVIEEIIQNNPKQTEEFRSGKDKLLGFFVGQAMKATGGKGNPALLQELVIKKLKG